MKVPVRFEGNMRRKRREFWIVMKVEKMMIYDFNVEKIGHLGKWDFEELETTDDRIETFKIRSDMRRDIEGRLI